MNLIDKHTHTNTHTNINKKYEPHYHIFSSYFFYFVEHRHTEITKIVFLMSPLGPIICKCTHFVVTILCNIITILYDIATKRTTFYFLHIIIIYHLVNILTIIFDRSNIRYIYILLVERDMKPPCCNLCIIVERDMKPTYCNLCIHEIHTNIQS